MCVAPAPQCLRVPASTRSRRGRGDAGNVLHGLDQRLRSRAAAGGGDGALSRRHRAASARPRFSSPPRAAPACSPRPDPTRSAAPARRSARDARSTTARRTSSRSIRELTGGRGVDLILDIMGGSYVPRNLAALAVDGRLVQIGLMGGETASDRSPPRARPPADDHRLDAAAASGGGEGRRSPPRSRARSGRCSKPDASSRSSTGRFRWPRRPPRIG